MSQSGNRPASAARLAGDDYQHLVTLNEVLLAVHGNDVKEAAVEASDAGNVDDLVLYGREIRYIQIKHATDGRTPVGGAWLQRINRPNGKSLLQRFHESWLRLGGRDSRPHLQLVTDRDLDPLDPMMQYLDRRSGILDPTANRKSAEAASAWAGHLGVNLDALLLFLQDLHFVTGRSFQLEHERASLLLQSVGLTSDRQAIDSGLLFIREWAQSRERRLGVAEIALQLEERIVKRHRDRAGAQISEQRLHSKSIPTSRRQELMLTRIPFVGTSNVQLLYPQKTDGSRVSVTTPGCCFKAVRCTLATVEKSLTPFLG
jgi:hypothetical protein